MVNQNNYEKNQEISKILKSVIKKCVIEISRIVNQYTHKEFSFFEALDHALEFYKLEDEIIVNYNEELMKLRPINKNFSLNPKEINIAIRKIKHCLYEKYLEKFNNKKP